MTTTNACDGCSEPPTAPPTSECVLDSDCGVDEICDVGDCVPAPTPSEGEGEEGEGEGAEGEGETAPVGILTVLPEDNVEFGAVRLGDAVERNITLKNTGPVALRILQIVVDDDQGVFTAEPTGFLDLELAPDAEIGVALVHIPNDGVPDSAELEVLHTGEGGLTNIELFAEFKGTPTLSLTEDVAILEPDVDTLDFGDVASGSSVSRRLLVRNDGSLDSVLAVSGAVVTPSAGPFQVVTPGLNPPLFLSSFDAACVSPATCPASAPDCNNGFCLDASGVPPDAIPVTITFAPNASGDASATITLTTTDGGTGSPVQRDVTLTGRGVTGLLVVTPSTVTFDDAFVGRTQRRTVNVSNQGAAGITIDAFDFVPAANSPFVVEHALPSLPYTVAANEAFDVDVVFSPLSAGQFARTLTVRTDGEQDTPVEVVGNARVAPVIEVLDEVSLTEPPPTGLAFGDVYTGFSQARTLRIVNIGALGSVLHVLRVAIDGPQAARFSVAPSSLDGQPLPGSINLEPHAELEITYLPGPLTGFDDTAVLIIESDDPDAPWLEVNLAGRSVQPIIEVSDETIDFGPVLVGTTPSPQRTFTIRNGGFGPLVISSITAPDRAEFQLGNAGPTTLDFGETVQVSVTFTPVAAQFLTSFIDINSSDRARPTVTVAIGGGGDNCPPRANAAPPIVVGSQCVYTCLGGFHACGDACLANNSPDSCGTSCTPCASPTNMSRGCIAATSTCTFSCNPSFFDNNNNISDGCEHECDFVTPTNEQCDDLDNDCDGTPDDGLPLESSEPPNSCSNNAENFGNVNDNNQPVTFTGYKLYPAGDEDWFRFTAHEDEFNFCIGSEPYRTTIELLDIPAGRDFDLAVRDQSCNGTEFISINGGNANENITLDWSGGCGGDDNRTFFIRVHPFPVTGPDDSCEAYRLRITHDRR